MVCKNEIGLRNSKTHKHRNWTIHPEFDPNHKVMKGKYDRALCSVCNM